MTSLPNCYVYPKFSPFKNSFDKYVRRMVDSGIVNRWERQLAFRLGERYY